MKHLIILSLWFSSPVFAQVNKQKAGLTTVNEVVQFIFQTEQKNIETVINTGLKNKKIKKGKFFVGEMQDADKILGKAGLKNFPQVYSTENGFSFKIENKEIKIEVKDALMGEVYLNGERIKINNKMSYKSLHRSIQNTLKKLDKRTSSYNPFNLLINKANAFACLGLCLAAGAALVVGGVASYIIDNTFSYLGHVINSDTQTALRNFEEKVKGIANSCKSDLHNLKNSSRNPSDNSAVSAVATLGDALKEVQDNIGDDDSLIYCKEFARKDSVEFESAIFKIDYDSLLATGCKSFEELNQCMVDTKRYMEENDIDVNDSSHELSESSNYQPYIEAIKSAVGK